MNTDIFFCSFSRMSYYFWMITWVENVNNCKIANLQPQGICLVFIKIAYKNNAA